jgi:hypothetical protein
LNDKAAEMGLEIGFKVSGFRFPIEIEFSLSLEG